MIKAKLISTDGELTLMLGLSRTNTERLHAGEPIFIPSADLTSMGLPKLHIAIMAGETEAAMSVQLGGLPLQPEVAGQILHQRPNQHRQI